MPPATTATTTATAPKSITRHYEGLFLFGTASTSNVESATTLIRSFIEKHGGTVHVLKKWDDRKLAYEVKKQTRGLYLLSFFEAPTASVEAINREVNLNDEVLRCLITDAEHLSTAEVDKMEPQKPEPKPELDEEGRPIRRRPADTELTYDPDEIESDIASDDDE